MKRFLVFSAPLFSAALLLVAAGCGGGSSGSFIAAPSPKLSISSITFSGATPQTFTVSEPGYNGSFTAVSSNTNVATVVGVSSGSVSALHRDATSSGAFTVTPVSGGTASIEVADSNGNSTTIPVSVTSATLVTQ